MNVLPKINVSRFEQLAPGSLFILEVKDTRCVAVKAIDKNSDDDPMLVILGAESPAGIRLGQILPWQEATVISFGTQYSVILPTSPDGWDLSAPPTETLALAVRNEEIYVRANYSAWMDEFRPCFVGLSDGKVHYPPPAGIIAYAKKWKIVTVDHEQSERMIFSVGL